MFRLLGMRRCACRTIHVLDNMERPTSALQRAGYAARGPLNAEPHTKEVGRAEVYNHRGVRSSRGHHGRRSVTPGRRDARAAFLDIGPADARPLRPAARA